MVEAKTTQGLIEAIIAETSTTYPCLLLAERESHNRSHAGRPGHCIEMTAEDVNAADRQRRSP